LDSTGVDQSVKDSAEVAKIHTQNVSSIAPASQLALPRVPVPFHAAEISSLSLGTFGELEGSMQAAVDLSKVAPDMTVHQQFIDEQSDSWAAAAPSTNAKRPLFYDQRVDDPWTYEESQYITFLHVQQELRQFGHSAQDTYKYAPEQALQIVSDLETRTDCLSMYSDGSYSYSDKFRVGGGVVINTQPVRHIDVPLNPGFLNPVEVELAALLCGVILVRRNLRERPFNEAYTSVAVLSDCLSGLESIAGHHMPLQSHRVTRLAGLCRRELLTLAREAHVHIFLAWAPRDTEGIATAHKLAYRAARRAALVRPLGRGHRKVGTGATGKTGAVRT
jgi:hypothetical protein